MPRRWDFWRERLGALPWPRRVLIGLGPLVVAAATLLIVARLCALLDPERPVRELALADARALLERDYQGLWEHASPCFRQRDPDWVRRQRLADDERGAQRAPADTRYRVVGVEREGVYRRVDVRVELPDGRQQDREIVLRQYRGRWAVVDRGGLGHRIEDACGHSGGSGG